MTILGTIDEIKEAFDTFLRVYGDITVERLIGYEYTD